MEIMSKAKGKIEISEDHLLEIPEGLFGFEEYTKFALVDSDYEPFIWLQSCENANLAFLIVDPFLICSTYETDIDDSSLFFRRFYNSLQNCVVRNIKAARPDS